MAPNNDALAGCLHEMVELPGQLPIFIIVDALDECQNSTGTPTAREEVLDLWKMLSGRIIRICSSASQVAQSKTYRQFLVPWPLHRAVCSFTRKVVQRKDIDSYIREFVLKDRAIRRRRELVITTLSRRAKGM